MDSIRVPIQNDAHLTLSVDHERGIAWLASDCRYYEEGYDRGALEALIRALAVARDMLPEAGAGGTNTND